MTSFRGKGLEDREAEDWVSLHVRCPEEAIFKSGLRLEIGQGANLGGTTARG